jgi:hypothetical protein
MERFILVSISILFLLQFSSKVFYDQILYFIWGVEVVLTIIRIYRRRTSSN